MILTFYQVHGHHMVGSDTHELQVIKVQQKENRNNLKTFLIWINNIRLIN